ncbi:hypothetical protein PHYBOEH_009740 [Phytophthora boehmeriae]|uniref:RxLR effector protein n=1 Tax=Phytophthora boehmeriae TaxID=109152 RepID=A0A8T1VSD1_9STRA|nr:hypothetical protein PHYBOEH_009740 [Phytophthora boehmeriae]
MRLRYLVLMIAALSSIDATSVVAASSSTTSVATLPRLIRSIADEYDGGANQRSLRSVETIDKDDEERALGRLFKKLFRKKSEEEKLFKLFFRQKIKPEEVRLPGYETYYLGKMRKLRKRSPS